MDKIRSVVSETPHHSVEIFVEGMGTLCQIDGSPIYLEFYEGSWQLVVWSDIEKEDPTHRIDMSGALESLRRVKEAPNA